MSVGLTRSAPVIWPAPPVFRPLPAVAACFADKSVLAPAEVGATVCVVEKLATATPSMAARAAISVKYPDFLPDAGPGVDRRRRGLRVARHGGREPAPLLPAPCRTANIRTAPLIIFSRWREFIVSVFRNGEMSRQIDEIKRKKRCDLQVRVVWKLRTLAPYHGARPSIDRTKT